MAQAVRQSNLFVAEDWKVVYKAFQEVNFTAFDFDSIRAALVEYIRINFPEDFNDWIESSEFVALIDLLAYLGQSLAFRMDLNTRENFIDTAESRDSILRLARMLSYTPRRNLPAFGLVKLVSVQTDESIIDSENRNLSGVQVDWNSAINPDWFEQFVLVLNSAFNASNPFGDAVKQGTINGIRTELYEFNNVLGINAVFPFTTSISGRTVAMELVPSTFEDLGNIEERSPDPFEAFNVLYRNDGRGNGSPGTGFFLTFKQGTLQFQDFELTNPIENRVIDIDVTNVNETDVFFQEINEDGQILTNWTQVPTVAPSSNIIFNAIDRLERDIFTVLTRDNDEVSLRFADGRFGNIPQGLYRAWYRTSNGLSYIVRPQDIQNFSVTFPYQNVAGQTFNLTLEYSLQEAVSNSIPRETNESIKERAPQVFYTQDRMVNGEDYNIFPLIKSGEALKIKAVNRTYSGHSRFVDVNDPTGTLQNTNVFADDGLFYKEADNDITEVSITTSLTFRQIINNFIETAIRSTDLKNFVTTEGPQSTNFALEAPGRTIWRTATQATNSSTGWFEINGSPQTLGSGEGDPFNLFTIGAIVNLVPIDDVEDSGIWVKLANIVNNGNGQQADGTGTVTIDERINDSEWIAKKVIPSFNTSFTFDEEELIEDQLELKNTFGVAFDFTLKEWYIVEPQDVAAADSTFSLDFARNKSGGNLDASWLVRVEFTASSWRFITRGVQFIWESVKDVRFFFINEFATVNIENGAKVQDQIVALKTNSKPDSNEPLDDAITIGLDRSFIFEDGFVEPRRVLVTFFDEDGDGTPDDPEIFDKIVGDGDFLFWEKVISVDGYETEVPIDVRFEITDPPGGTNTPNPVDGDLAFQFDPNDLTQGTFFEYDADTDTWVDVTGDYTFNAFGRKGIFFNWKHFAKREDRIDPAITNIIDIFALTTSYDTAIRNWIAVNGEQANEPVPPTSDQLNNTFADLDNFKMVSDELIWRPAKYKVLFGAQAEEELRAKFRIVKVLGTSVSDNEIKTRVIESINTFFEIENWDFGDTFYFTELAGFIHQRLATIVASVVLVPLNEESAFGNLFQVKAEPDEIFISAARVSDIDIVDNLTPDSLRIGN